MSLDLSALAGFVAAPVNRNAAPKNASLLSLEDARDAVVVAVTDPKGSVDVGKKYINLKLGQRKLALDAIAPKADRLAVGEDQVDAVVETLTAEVAKGTFDDAIVAAQAAIKASYEAAQAKKVAAQAEADAPVATEEEAVAATGGVDLDELENELDV